MFVRVHAYNIVQVNVGPSPNELLYYLQTALLCSHHQRSLPILEQREREGTETNKQINYTVFSVTLCEVNGKEKKKKKQTLRLSDDSSLVLCCRRT